MAAPPPAVPLPQIAPALDAGNSLTPAEYRAVLDAQSAVAGSALAPPLAELNDAPPAPPRVVLLPQHASALMPDVIETYLQPLVAAGRRSGLVLQRVQEGQPANKRQRAGDLPDGVSYDGTSFSGRVNFLPSPRTAVPLIGKRAGTWRRMQDGAVTAKVSDEDSTDT